MKRIVFGFAAILFLTFAAPSAHARLMFGKGEQVEFVSDTTVSGPAGQKLFLGRKVTTSSFLLPYSVHDDGYVFGVVGDSKRYYPFPDASKVKDMQTEGLLPNPLPAWEMPLFDKLFGNALWIALVGIVGYTVLQSYFSKKKETAED
jgi:hypothetical protein